ncbi:uncharacterized protein [Antedon mediterranea]|uniref:uncharacterized protein n=1 Tax=Antedon mediterranea TaxID=105859 RepID=UPI003AF76799
MIFVNNNRNKKMQGTLSLAMTFFITIIQLKGSESNLDAFSPSEIHAIEGSNVSIILYLKTNTSQNDDNLAKWMKDGRDINKSDQRYIFREDKQVGKFSLMINPVQQIDNGNYQVVYNQETSDKTNLNVIKTPFTDATYRRDEFEKTTVSNISRNNDQKEKLETALLVTIEVVCVILIIYFLIPQTKKKDQEKSCHDQNYISV